MKETTSQFLNLFFNPGEEACISPNQFGFKSIPIDRIDGQMALETQGKYEEIKDVYEDEINLCAINPIKGERNDLNVTAFRSFLVEIDFGDVYEQKQYIDALKMPYSICVFSGNKSLHYGIVLNEDLTTEELWRDIAEWILAVVDKADKLTKNPSRSIRFPGNQRNDGKQLMQSLVDIRGRVDLDILLDWLDQWPDKNPRIKKVLNRKANTPIELSTGIPKWICEKLEEGVHTMGNRNNQWFMMVQELAKRGQSEQAIIEGLGPFFIPEHDFTLREWHTIIKSAVKRVERGMYE